MIKKPKLNIKGTLLSSSNAQLLVSTGIPALDTLLGGGVPIGTVVLIDEDITGAYSNVILRYFLAEGAVHQHGLFAASLAVDTQKELIEKMPGLIRVKEEPRLHREMDDKLKIAFQYQGLPTKEAEAKSHFGNYFDLTAQMHNDIIKGSDIHKVNCCENCDPNHRKYFKNHQYDHLMKDLSDVLLDEKYRLDENLHLKNVLRVCLHQLGTPLWNDGNDYNDLRKFVFYLRCMMRQSFAVAMVSLPSFLSEKFSNLFTDRLVYDSDITLKIEAFAGTPNENNPSLSDYHGFFHVIKLAAINSFASKHPGAVEYVFKLRRKKFCIEKLHLPPDIQDLNDDKKKKSEKPSLGCASSSKHLLEF